MAFSYRVSLQIRHPDADPQRIIAAIAQPLRRCWAAGDARETPQGTSLPGTYGQSYCAFDFGNGSDGELADFLRQALAKLEPAAAFIAELRRTGGTLNFFITWTPGERGEVFDVELLAAMARLGIDLGIEPIC
ncbi:hypothetical protein QH494_17605 [Sphingomonas sp. AR_OL41]|jgi:hypothetical protein|uniref:hypothetical protein n=1 Tax=Sphingomonas sp. AR_OL41 TaxID=3042729 RepID=UPI0024807E4F|nr:hypothetical protein [Sphingomonas sp. AR_OL41]MDH7974007.1 hypothetical protein [Sphingomonas sp. AR_OL41]